jgi:hypothetical protein
MFRYRASVERDISAGHAIATRASAINVAEFFMQQKWLKQNHRQDILFCQHSNAKILCQHSRSHRLSLLSNKVTWLDDADEMPKSRAERLRTLVNSSSWQANSRTLYGWQDRLPAAAAAASNAHGVDACRSASAFVARTG